MLEIHTEDFVGKRLKNIYHIDNGETLSLEFENGFRIQLKNIRNQDFVFKKESIHGETDEQKQKREKEKKQALGERKAREAKQKNRPKEKKQ